jgi:membrane fusion protein (multidrug efflux system)
MRSTTWAAVLFCALSASASAQQADSGTAVPVGTVEAHRAAVAQALTFVGRVEAIARVEVRARVTGYLEEVLFSDGQMVKEGDLLYRIERDSFQAAVKQAEGSLVQSRAQLVLTSRQRERTEDLISKGFETEVRLDQATALEEQAKGEIIINEASFATAQINLGYTEIFAPISGRIGRTSVTKGNVVGPDSGVLTVIVSQDPMYVTFPVSQREFLRAQETGKTPDLSTLKVRIRFANGSVYPELGRIDFVAPTVDRATDTVAVRAAIPNPNRALVDGQLVEVEVEAEKPVEKIVVPQTALLADQAGIYVFVVEDGKAAVRRVKPAGESGSNTVIEEGLAEGEQVIVEGLQAVRPGQAVQASPVSPASSSE